MVSKWLFVFFFCTFLSVTAFADNVRIEQVHVNMPQIDVYYYIDSINANINISASLNNEKLDVAENIPFDNNSYGTTFIFLVDVSTSISNIQIDNIRKAILAFANTIGSKDKISIISFGERVDLLVDSSDDIEVIKDGISKLSNNQIGTLFYNGLYRAMEIANIDNDSINQRKAALVITDSNDFTAGGYTTDELFQRVQKSNLPFYAIALSHGKKDKIDMFGRLARTSGGNILVTSDEDIENTLLSTYDTIKSCNVVKLLANNNLVSNSFKNLKLTFSLEGKSFHEQKDILIDKWIADETAPFITSVLQLSNNSIKIFFSEDVLNADANNNFLISDINNNIYDVKNASYSLNDFSTTLTLAQEMVTGKINISCLNIADNSMEKNAIADPLYSLDVKGIPPFVKGLDDFITNFWLIIVVFILIILILVLYLIISKRNGFVMIDGKITFKDNVSIKEKHHFVLETSKTVPLNIIVTDSSGKTTELALNVDKSIIVGRSDICDLYFDDSKMSRQHFAIEVIDNEFYISNLNTTNGTFLNGVKLNNKCKLNIGDVILAGQEKFTIKIMGV